MKTSISVCSGWANNFLAPWRNILSNRVINKGGCLLQFNYVIVAHGVCILSISVAGRLSGNNRPVDTPPTSLNTTFDYSSL